MEIITLPISAGETKVLAIAGEYFELVNAPQAVDVALYSPTGAKSSAQAAEEGSYLRVGFTEVQIKSATTQTIRVLIAEKEGGTRRLAGSVVINGVPHVVVDSLPDVNIGNIPHVVIDSLPAVSIADAKNGAFTNAGATVNTGSAQLLAAKANRRYLLIQNASQTANVFVRLDGGAAGSANGVKIGPGGSYELSDWAPTGAITAASDANGTPVVVVEG